MDWLEILLPWPLALAALSAYLVLCLPYWARLYALYLAAGRAPDAASLWRSWAASLRLWRAPYMYGPARLLCWGTALALGAANAGLCLLYAPAGQGIFGAALGILLLAAVALAWLDAASGLLPDALVLPLLLAGLAYGQAGFWSSLGAAAGVWLLLWAASALYRRWRGRDGFGYGDVKFLAAIAAWLGFDAAWLVLWLASVLGLLWWFLQAKFGRAASTAGATASYPTASYPFGPPLALALCALLMLQTLMERI